MIEYDKALYKKAGPTTFLDIAIAGKLEFYVQNKLEAENDLTQAWLYPALLPREMGFEESDPNIRMIERLLNRGYSPNAHIENCCNVWDHFLCEIDDPRGRRITETQMQLYYITRLLILNGVNMESVVQTGSRLRPKYAMHGGMPIPKIIDEEIVPIYKNVENDIRARFPAGDADNLLTVGCV
jgi:hypothetical protein